MCGGFENGDPLDEHHIYGGNPNRKLSEKYGVPFSTLKEHARRENWRKLRTKAEEKADTKFAFLIGEKEADRASKIDDVANKLLDKISKTLDDPEITLTTQEIKHYTSALKDIKDIKGIRSDLDYEEQKARIEKLRKEAMGEEQEKDIVVTMGEVDKYAN